VHIKIKTFGGFMLRTLFVVFFLLVTVNCVAQTLSCKYVAGAGLAWENGKWTTQQFTKPSPFYLETKTGGKSLDENTVARALNASEAICIGKEIVFCTVSVRLIGDIESTPIGPVLSITLSTPGNFRGSVAYVRGGFTSDDEKEKDFLVIFPFTCKNI
jgi:hypothetical protein